jgi:ribonuclease P protein component
MKFTYNKTEKLKSKKLIDQLFTEGQSVSAFPLRLVYLKTGFKDEVLIKTGVSVSKRYFKNAVDRNRIKRLMREAYRLHKPQLFNKITTRYACMILYIGKEGTDFDSINNATVQLFTKFLKSEEASGTQHIK